MQGDEVLAVNGMDVTGKSAFEVLSSIQGPNETSVTLKVVILFIPNSLLSLPKEEGYHSILTVFRVLLFFLFVAPFGIKIVTLGEAWELWAYSICSS